MADLYYYESGYFDPELGYFVYTADAASAITASTSIDCNAGVIKSAQSTMSVTVEVTATISHIEGADLFAFTEALLAAEVSVIRDNNIAASSAFSIATDVSRTRNYSSDDSAEFTIVVANQRVRFSEAAVDAAFSLTADVTMVPGGEVIEATGSWSSEFTQSAVGERIANLDSDLSSSFAQSVEINKTVQLSSEQSSSASLNVSADRLRDIGSSLSSSVSVTAEVNEIVQLASSLSSTSSVSCTISHIEGADLQAFTNASLNANADRTRNVQSAITSNATVTAVINEIQSASAEISSAFTQNATATKFAKYWYAQYDSETTSNTNFTDIEIDTDGNLISAGTYNGSKDLLLVKQDKYGQVLWSRSLASASNETSARIGLDSSNNIYVTGTGTTGIIAKYNSSGTIQWQRKLTPSSGSTLTRDIAVTSSGDIYAVGSGGGGQLIVKYNSSGTIQWQKTVPTGQLLKVELDSAGAPYVLVTGSSTNFNLIKFTTTGSISWIRQVSIGTANSIEPQAITIDSSNNIYICALVSVTAGLKNVIAKYNSSGVIQWTKGYSFSNTFQSLAWSQSRLFAGSDGHDLIELDPINGEVTWSKTYDRTGDMYIAEIKVVSDSIYVAGQEYITVSPQNLKGAISKWPVNGSGTPTSGTYTTYSQTVDNSFTITTNTPSTPTVSNATNTDAAGTLTDSANAITAYAYVSIEEVGEYLTASASLSSTSSLTSSVAITRRLQSSAASQFALSANPDGFTREASASLTSEGFVVAAFGRIRPLASLEDTSFAVSADITANKKLSSSISSTASLTSTVTKQLGPITANLASSAQLTVTGVKTTEIILSADNFADMQTTAVKIAVGNSSVTGNFSQSAQVDIGKIAQANLESTFNQSVQVTKQLGPITASLESSATLTTDAKIIAGVVITLEAVTSELVSIGRIRPFVSLEDTKFDLSASSIITASAQSQQSSSTSLTLVPTKQIGPITSSMSATASVAADADVRAAGYVGMSTAAQMVTTAQIIAGATASASIQSTLTAIGRETSDIASDMSGEFTQTAAAIKTAQANANLQSSANLTAQPKVIRRGISLEFSFADMDVDADVIRTLTAEMSSETTASTTAVKTAGASSAMQAVGFQLTIGRVIDLTNAVKWTIPPETRNRIVPRSNQNWTIKPENRTYKFKG